MATPDVLIPSEQHLLEEERARRLILHFEVTQVLIMSDLENGLTTDQVLNEILAEMAWGVLDTESGEWVLESEQPTLNAPDKSMISYTQYIREKFPNSSDVEDEKTQAENSELQTKAKHRFTAKGEPGQKFRGVYDQLVKNMTVPNGVKKGYGIEKVRVNETELPQDPNVGWDANLVRFGRFRLLPSFFKLLDSLNREKPRKNVTIVLRSPSKRLLEEVAEEINNFCNTQHPCYSGTNRTKKAIMNGDKGSIDFQLKEANVGQMVTGDENPWYLSFDARNKVVPPPVAEDPDEITEPPPPEPTLYDGVFEMYCGLVKEITMECAMCCVEDKQEKDMPEIPPKLLVDPGDTRVHQIYLYPGTKTCNVKVLHAKTSTLLDTSDSVIRVDPYRAVTELEYFLREIAQCEALRTRKLLEEKIAPVSQSAELTADELRALPPKEYLYRTVLPALLPGLQVITRDRPPDPILWLALYLLRHPKQYSKVLAADSAASAQSS
jgi:hypothetical protein